MLGNKVSRLVSRTCSVKDNKHVFLATVFALVSACATVSFDEPKDQSRYLADTAQTELGDWTSQWVEAHEGVSGFYPLSGGLDALVTRLGLAEKAQKSIDLQYFIMKGDTAGLAVFKSLLMAADRGVRVRVLLDDIWTTTSDRKLVLLNEHPNIEVRLFNPVSRRGFTWLNIAFDFRRANRRMHNKSFSVDNAMSIIGGRNIGDEYFELKDDAVFVDFDVLAAGPIVSEISESFDDFWNHSHAMPIENIAKPLKNETLESFRATTGVDLRVLHGGVIEGNAQSNLLQDVLTGQIPLYPASARVIADSPDILSEKAGPEHQLLVEGLSELLLDAEHELVVVSPYYVPLKNGIQFAREARSRGIEITMVTNSLASTNHIAVHSGYSKYRRDAIRAGVKLYESRANAGRSIAADDEGPDRLVLHTKLIVVDRRYLVVGSPNMDPRSLEINAEKGLIIDSEALAGIVVEGILEQLPATTYQVIENESGKLEWRGRIDGEEVVVTREPQASRSRRLAAWFLKIVPDSQL
jgi:putative cardiolipin synthase